ncbi:MAG: SH3 domain-containing protein [Lachnospiraceae bacterium]|nr:SH3 domain-containing protein [Lachnospiraceae bacterium]
MKNRFWKKAISILCASACLLSSAPVTALADGEFGGSLSVGGISTLLEEFFAKEDKKEDDVKEFVEKHGNAKDISCDNVAISKVEDYVNVRSGPSTEHEVIGKIFDQCAATILSTTTEEDGDWYHVISGNCDGYIKAEFFATGEEAREYAMQTGNMYMKLIEDGVNVREEPNLDCEVVTVLYEGATATVTGEEDGFVAIVTKDGEEGYIKKEFVKLFIDCDTAMTLEEEQAMLEEMARLAREEQERLEREWREEQERLAREEAERLAREEQERIERERREAEEAAARYAAYIWGLRQTVVDYCYSKLGCAYIWGAEGPNAFDCSGLVKCAYEQIGVYLYHQSGSQGQEGAYRSVSQAEPGDILWRSGHVGIYIGDGLCIHAANENVGVIISSVWDCDWVCARSLIG